MKGLLQVAVIVLLAFVLSSRESEARHSMLMCKKWSSNCNKYERYCNDNTPTDKRPNTSTANSTNTTTNSTNNLNTSTIINITSISNFAKVWSNCCGLAELQPMASSGVYNIHSGDGYFSHTVAYCEMETQQGGWTVIQRRTNGMEKFNRTWNEYENGFGNLENEFWYGLGKIHRLTKDGDWELRVDLVTSKEEKWSASYSKFVVQGQQQKYKLTAEGHTGVTDFLTQFTESSFSTQDNDNDGVGALNCAEVLRSGWWYLSSCLADKALNLNGKYDNEGIKWDSFNTHYITSTEMKIRPKSCHTQQINEQERTLQDINVGLSSHHV